jgi:cob(I)alamin adenosyltransferase
VGHRLSKITTRTGDDGTTGLGDGSRVAKDSLRIAAIGAVDELNSSLGLLLAELADADLRTLITDLQHDLFDLGGELSIPGFTCIDQAHILRLETTQERFNATLEPLKEFILPGGNRASAACHLARTVCRRAEREVVSLASGEAMSPFCQQYLNRLSDLLFVLSRVISRRAGQPDVLWQKHRVRGGG